MRTLCLDLQKNEKPSVAENFLTFSPQVQFREPGLVFVDISSTAQIFGGETGLLREALDISKEFFPHASAAIADAPSVAQVFSSVDDHHIVKPNEDREELRQLSLSSLTHLEGLIAWNSVHEIQEIVCFFETLGFDKIGDIQKFDIESFRERWGDTGALLWKRLNGIERQVISPLTPTDSLVDYVHLDFPVSLVPFLLHCIEKSLQRLFVRLQGRGEFAQKINLHLYCEYSDKYHLLELTPAEPSRDLELFLKLLENRLVDVDLENPIRQLEVEIVSCLERQQQLDFWHPRIRDEDKLKQLISVFNQTSLATGYFNPVDRIMPEDSWQITAEAVDYYAVSDSIEFEEGSALTKPAFQLKPSHSQSLSQAPRPSRLLESPRPISEKELRQLHFLSNHPIERLEDSWWQDSRGRDYFFALTPQGESLWIYHDRIEDQYFIHGYFD